MTLQDDIKALLDHPQPDDYRRALDAEALLEKALSEIERLHAALIRANQNHEEFERKWYLAQDERDEAMAALEQLKQWSEAYPLAVFPEPDFAKAHDVLSANGMTLDAISASNMRYVITQVRKIIDAAIAKGA